MNAQIAMNTPADKARLLRSFFVTREDRVAAWMEWGEKSHPQPVEGGEYIDGLIAAHVSENAPQAFISTQTRRGRSISKGRPRIGFYAPDMEGKTRWGCLDFDDHDRQTDLADPLGVALQAYSKDLEIGLPLDLVLSGG